MFHQLLLRPIILGMKSLKLHKLRAVLTTLGVVFGVSSVIIMLAVGEGARAEAIAAIEELGATNIIVRSVNPLPPGAQLDFGANRYGLTNRDVQRFRSSLSSLRAVAPTRDHPRDIHRHNRRMSGRVVAVTPDYYDLHDLQLADGRFIEELDVSHISSVAVLGAQAARELFPIDDPVGKSVRIGDHQYFQVVGILLPRAFTSGLAAGRPAEDYGRDIYIPFSTDAKRFGENITFDRMTSIAEKVEISQLVLSVRETKDVNPAAQVVESILQERNKEDQTAMTVPLDLLEKAEQTQQMFTLVLTAIASISLLVGGIGIMNIMLATVTERTREIGIRRALGARRADIVAQFLVETTVLSCGGGLLGIVLGIVGAGVAGNLAEMPTQIRPWVPIMAFGIAIAVGLVFGTFPARRAAAMDPVEALRHD